MSENLKMPRLYKFGGYTTGDNDHWTYEYTWEDLDAAIHFVTTNPQSTQIPIRDGIVNWFLEDPDRITDEVRKHIDPEILATIDIDAG